MLVSFEDKRAVFRQKWHGKTPSDQGFDFMNLAQIRRKDSNTNEYHLYKNEKEYDMVENETIILALESTEKSSLVKIHHANCRLKDFIPNEELEKIPDEEKIVYSSKVSADEVIAQDSAPPQASSPAEQPQPAEPADEERTRPTKVEAPTQSSTEEASGEAAEEAAEEITAETTEEADPQQEKEETAEPEDSK